MSLMIVDPYRFSSITPPPGDVVIAVQDFLTGTTTGVTSYTSTQITGVTPKAAILIGALHDPTNDDGETVGMSRSVCISDGARKGGAFLWSESGVADTDVSGGASGARILIVLDNAGVSLKGSTGTFVNISGGIQFSYSTNSSPSLRHYWLGFAGADTRAHANEINLGTGTSALDQTAPGFEPQVVITNGAMLDSVGTTNAGVGSVFGIATSDGTQRCVLYTEADNIATGRPFAALLTDAVAGSISSATGALGYKSTVSDFDASGFSITSSASAGSDLLYYLALDFGPRSVKIVDFTTPTSTGDSTITGAGFRPSFALVVLTNLETVDDFPGSTSANMCGFSICAINSTVQTSASWRVASGVATTDTGSQVSNVAILGPSNTDCDAIRGTFVGWTSDGMTINYSAVQGTGKKGFILFVQ